MASNKHSSSKLKRSSVWPVLITWGLVFLSVSLSVTLSLSLLFFLFFCGGRGLPPPPTPPPHLCCCCLYGVERSTTEKIKSQVYLWLVGAQNVFLLILLCFALSETCVHFTQYSIIFISFMLCNKLVCWYFLGFTFKGLKSRDFFLKNNSL